MLMILRLHVGYTDMNYDTTHNKLLNAFEILLK